MTLQQSQPLLESILNSVGSGIVVADRSGNFLLYNPAAEQMFGQGATLSPPGEWPHIYGFFAEDGVTPLTEDQLPLVRAMRGESVDAMRVYVKNEHMREGLWLSVNVRPLVAANGELDGGVIAFDDVTKLKNLEKAIAKSNTDLEQFASVAAHDLQEPLRTIVSFLDLLDRRLKDNVDEKSRHYMNNVVAGAKRMQILINDLLAYSRIRSRGKPFKSVNMQELVQVALEDLGELIESTGAQVSVDSLPLVSGDESQLKHLLMNLVHNAIKFRSADKPQIKIGVSNIHKKVGLVTFFVQDNGIGIDKRFHERIFVIFQRLHDMETYAGTGIGLALCKQIVDRHGGRIFVESEEGMGATFFFTLPLEVHG